MCILAEQLEFSDDFNLPTCWQGWSVCFTWFFYTSQKILLCQAQNRAQRNENVSVPILIFSTNMCHYCILNGTTFIALFETFYHHLPSPLENIAFYFVLASLLAFFRSLKRRLNKTASRVKTFFCNPRLRIIISPLSLCEAIFCNVWGIQNIVALLFWLFTCFHLNTHFFLPLYRRTKMSVLRVAATFNMHTLISHTSSGSSFRIANKCLHIKNFTIGSFWAALTAHFCQRNWIDKARINQ